MHTYLPPYKGNPYCVGKNLYLIIYQLTTFMVFLILLEVHMELLNKIQECFSTQCYFKSIANLYLHCHTIPTWHVSTKTWYDSDFFSCQWFFLIIQDHLYLELIDNCTSLDKINHEITWHIQNKRDKILHKHNTIEDRNGALMRYIRV